MGNVSNSNTNTRTSILLGLVRRLSGVVDFFVLFLSFVLLFLGLYALWDRNHVLEAGSSDIYKQYKVIRDNKLSYEQVKGLNSDVIGWVQVYGTEIDYPVLQTTDNYRYLNESVTGQFSTAGSIFLDYRNNKNFSDFNSVIYGHHMENSKMFGDVSLFAEKKFFNSHKYGVLHRVDLPSKGIEFFALVKTHGADSTIFNVPITANPAKQKLLDYINNISIFKRDDVKVNINDNIVFLNTCTFTTTNGRYILVGKLVDKVHDNNFANDENGYTSLGFTSEIVKGLPFILWIIIILIILLILLYIAEKIRERKNLKQHQVLRERE